MEREIKNNSSNMDIDNGFSNERLESLAASEMADRGPKAIDTNNNDWSTTGGKTSLMGVSNPGRAESDEDEDDEDVDDDIDLDDEDLDVAAPAVTDIDSTEIDDTNIEDDDLDIELDDEEEEEDI
jgi:hypothetical protein